MSVGEGVDEFVVEEVNGGFVLCDFDFLALSGALSVDECGDDLGGGDGCEGEVGVEGADADGRSVGVSGVGGDAGECGDAVADAAVGGFGSGGAHDGEGGVDEVGFGGAELLVGEAEFAHGAGGEVVGDDVEVWEEFEDELSCLGEVEVEGEGAFVGVGVVEEGAGVDGEALWWVGEFADGVDAGGGFDFDDVGAEVGEEFGDEWSGGHPAEVEDADAL